MISYADNATENGAFVPVMVPSALVPEVLRLIADRLDTPAQPASAADEDMTHVWPIEKLRKFSASRVKTALIVSEVLDYLAERPDVPVPTSELMTATGRTTTGLRAAWIKLAPHLEKHYGDPTWPLIKTRGPAIDLPSKETYYTIVGEQAVLWKQVRGKEGQTEQGNGIWDEAQRRAGRA